MRDNNFVRQWLELAECDLASARHLLTLYPNPLEIICYHCEQAAEKMLKAFLAVKDIPVPRTHDLTILKQLCAEQNVEFEQIGAMCVRLTPYGVQVRYPSDIEIMEEDMQLALRDAECVMNLIVPILTEELK